MSKQTKIPEFPKHPTQIKNNPITQSNKPQSKPNHKQQNQQTQP